MLRSLLLSTVLTSAPIAYVAHPTDAYALGRIVAVSFVTTLTMLLVIRRTRRRAQRTTLAALTRGGDTLDLILAEADRRAGQRGTPRARK